jgi:hypothetical protein
MEALIKKMKKAGLLAVTMALLVGLAAPAPDPVSAARGAYGLTVQKPSRGAEVSEERIRKHVEFLASDKLEGRRAGSPAEAEAAKYIAKSSAHMALSLRPGTSFSPSPLYRA